MNIYIYTIRSSPLYFNPKSLRGILGFLVASPRSKARRTAKAKPESAAKERTSPIFARSSLVAGWDSQELETGLRTNSAGIPYTLYTLKD